jgi:hypothetical protein
VTGEPVPTGSAGGPGQAEPGSAAQDPATDEDGDSLPADLDVTAHAGQYSFPDIRRRRWPALIYLLTAAICGGAWLVTRGDDPVLVTEGFLVLAVGLLAVGAYHLSAAWPLAVDDSRALVAAAREVGFAVGHASAQLGWRGLRSRPTWRILLYSTENPPTRRGLVLVVAVDGTVVEHLVEDNPEDWAQR